MPKAGQHNNKPRENAAQLAFSVPGQDAGCDRALWRLSLILREIADNSASNNHPDEPLCQPCGKDAGDCSREELATILPEPRGRKILSDEP